MLPCVYLLQLHAPGQLAGISSQELYIRFLSNYWRTVPVFASLCANVKDKRFKSKETNNDRELVTAVNVLYLESPLH